MDLLDRLRVDHPVLQAGLGGGIAGAELAAAVAAAGGLGTLGQAAPAAWDAGFHRVREQAPGRAVAVNLLMPFVHRRHVRACVAGRVDVAVLFYGGDAALVRTLHDAGAFVVSQVGTVVEAAHALGIGVDALIAQGSEAGGHLLGREPALSFLPRALAVADGRPVFVAGGVATGADTERALAAGAAGVVAGTRFLLTHESRAHPAYRQRVLTARETVETTLFGFGWPARHRVVAKRGDPAVAALRRCGPQAPGRAERSERADRAGRPGPGSGALGDRTTGLAATALAAPAARGHAGGGGREHAPVRRRDGPADRPRGLRRRGGRRPGGDLVRAATQCRRTGSSFSRVQPPPIRRPLTRSHGIRT